jgi:small neutral amino acid transporter SnatA (MarC family)
MPSPIARKIIRPAKALRMTSASVAQTPIALPTTMKPAISKIGISMTKKDRSGKRIILALRVSYLVANGMTPIPPIASVYLNE